MNRMESNGNFKLEIQQNNFEISEPNIDFEKSKLYFYFLFFVGEKIACSTNLMRDLQAIIPNE